MKTLEQDAKPRVKLCIDILYDFLMFAIVAGVFKLTIVIFDHMFTEKTGWVVLLEQMAHICLIMGLAATLVIDIVNRVRNWGNKE